jgi:hypothetical protein
MLDSKMPKRGLKFDEFLIACKRHFNCSLKCVKVREPELLTEPQTEQPCVARVVAVLLVLVVAVQLVQVVPVLLVLVVAVLLELVVPVPSLDSTALTFSSLQSLACSHLLDTVL